MSKYLKQTRVLVAVDCVVFGFDGAEVKLLLIKRALEPLLGSWSLMGGFIEPDESMDAAAVRVLKKLTGLDGVYLEQLHVFGNPERDPIERTISVVYFALIDINTYKQQLDESYNAEWIPLNNLPDLIFDHRNMVDMARGKLQYKAALHPILFELLPAKFTLPQLQSLYEGVYGTTIDKRNFSRKVLSTGLLIKQNEKDKENSKRGAFYYKLNKRTYKSNFQAFLNIIPNSHNLK
jgi:ADP-ribose pyrophosphatase YjhB (NUDIX family)